MKNWVWTWIFSAKDCDIHNQRPFLSKKVANPFTQFAQLINQLTQIFNDVGSFVNADLIN